MLPCITMLLNHKWTTTWTTQHHQSDAICSLCWHVSPCSIMLLSCFPLSPTSMGWTDVCTELVSQEKISLQQTTSLISMHLKPSHNKVHASQPIIKDAAYQQLNSLLIPRITNYICHMLVSRGVFLLQQLGKSEPTQQLLWYAFLYLHNAAG